VAACLGRSCALEPEHRRPIPPSPPRLSSGTIVAPWMRCTLAGSPNGFLTVRGPVPPIGRSARLPPRRGRPLRRAVLRGSQGDGSGGGELCEAQPQARRSTSPFIRHWRAGRMWASPNRNKAIHRPSESRQAPKYPRRQGLKSSGWEAAGLRPLTRTWTTSLDPSMEGAMPSDGPMVLHTSTPSEVGA
jgi:hypothetical protein